MSIFIKYGQISKNALFIILASIMLSSFVKAGNTPYTSSEPTEQLEIIAIEKLVHSANWNKLLNKLEKKAGSETAYFLDYLFYKTHQLLLKKYSKHTDFETMIQSGDYDCVSGSIAYSLLLTEFNIEHTIIETDYHVFIVARVEGKDYIFESTDPTSGFIQDEAAVIGHIAKFKPVPSQLKVQSTTEIGDENYETTEGNTIYREISFRELTGLQYYNQGIYAINNRDFHLAKVKVSQALSLYPSERIKSVLELIVDQEQSEK